MTYSDRWTFGGVLSMMMLLNRMFWLGLLVAVPAAASAAPVTVAIAFSGHGSAALLSGAHTLPAGAPAPPIVLDMLDGLDVTGELHWTFDGPLVPTALGCWRVSGPLAGCGTAPGLSFEVVTLLAGAFVGLGAGPSSGLNIFPARVTLASQFFGGTAGPECGSWDMDGLSFSMDFPAGTFAANDLPAAYDPAAFPGLGHLRIFFVEQTPGGPFNGLTLRFDADVATVGPAP